MYKVARILLLSYLCMFATSCLENVSKFGETVPSPSIPSIPIVPWLKQLGAVTAAPGGSNAGYDDCTGVAVDSSGNVYCAGYTDGAMGEANGGSNDALIMKFNSSGVLQWATQLGATTVAPGGSNAGNDSCSGVSVDSSGNVYCAGSTNGAMGEANGGGSDAFVVKLNSSGVLQWVTQLGATTTALGGSNAGSNYCNGVAVDSSGNVYCTGATNGATGEVNGGSYDAFVMKLNSSGVLQWVTQLGATTTALGGSNAGTDICNGVTVDSSGNVYCAGRTVGAMGEANGGIQDAFVMKLNSSGVLQWVAQLGAMTTAPGGSNTGNESCYGVSVDSSGNVYCAGSTGGAMGEANGGSWDALVMKLNSSGVLQWVTQLGVTTAAPGGNNAGADYCTGVTVDSSGNVYCAGGTDGAMGEANGGSYDALVIKLNSSGVLQWITQLGAATVAPGGSNAGYDYCAGVTVDSSGNVYCAGSTDGAIGEANGGGVNDIFVMKLNSSGELN